MEVDLTLLLVLQCWGLVFYLLHKVFCSQYERAKRHDKELAQLWRVRSWLVYLVGLPAVVWMLWIKQNFIFSALEASALPLMILGLTLASMRVEKDQIDKKLSKLDPVVYTLIGAGLGYSFRHFGGFVTTHQWLEITASAGFLVGTYLQAKDHTAQYAAYLVMNIATAVLFFRQDLLWFSIQQIVSIAFILDAYWIRWTDQALGSRYPTEA